MRLKIELILIRGVADVQDLSLELYFGVRDLPTYPRHHLRALFRVEDVWVVVIKIS